MHIYTFYCTCAHFCIYMMVAYTLLKMMKKIDDEIINNLPSSFQILYKMIQEAEMSQSEDDQ